MGKRIGIIGGSFDPIHLGHLIIAQDACEQFDLDLVLFLPAFQAPLKAKTSTASPEQRLEMTQLAVADEPRFEVSEVDFKGGNISYSLLSMQRLASEQPDDTFFWILGADQIEQLHQWRDIGKLAKLVSFIAFERAGADSNLSNLPKGIRVEFAKSRLIEISSTEIRNRIKSSESVKYFLPAPVLDYIKALNLYRPLSETQGATDKENTK